MFAKLNFFTYSEKAAEKASYEKYQVESNRGIEKLQAQMNWLTEQMDIMETDSRNKMYTFQDC